MFIIITRSSFTYILGATLIQYARTLTNKTPTITHQYSWQNSSWCYCTMGILTYGTTTELKLQKHDSTLEKHFFFFFLPSIVPLQYMYTIIS